MKTNYSNSQEQLVTLFYKVWRQLRRHLISTDHEPLNQYQLHALFTLSSSAGTMSELAAELGISHPSATSLVDRLVKHGWVERAHDKDDRRIIRLSLTAKGRGYLVQKKAERLQRITQLLDQLPPEDVDSLKRVFAKLHEILEQQKTN